MLAHLASTRCVCLRQVTTHLRHGLPVHVTLPLIRKEPYLHDISPLTHAYMRSTITPCTVHDTHPNPTPNPENWDHPVRYATDTTVRPMRPLSDTKKHVLATTMVSLQLRKRTTFQPVLSAPYDTTVQPPASRKAMYQSCTPPSLCLLRTRRAENAAPRGKLTQIRPCGTCGISDTKTLILAMPVAAPSRGSAPRHTLMP